MSELYLKRLQRVYWLPIRYPWLTTSIARILRKPLCADTTSPVWQVGPGFSAPHCACSAAPVSIRRQRSRVPRLGTRLGGFRLAVLHGVFVPTVQLALFRYRSDSEKKCPGN